MSRPRLATPTDRSTVAVLDRQVLVMFECADDVLEGVTLAECLHAFDADGWTVHERDGRWCGELAEEPPDVPTPTLAWTMWHPIWWMRTLLAHSLEQPVPNVDDVEWPGPAATLPTLRSCWGEWMTFVRDLDDEQLQSGQLTHWPYTDGRAFIHVVGWSSMELVKNLSEICLLRRLARDALR